MTFAIITHVPHILEQNRYFAYAPYVREMNIWIKSVDNVLLVAPKSKSTTTPIDSNYEHSKIDFIAIDRFDVLSLKATLKAFITIPKISWKVFIAMKQADHIHLRCPGNIGLIGSVVQILFPKKTKTAKYAGNWDPKSRQPLSYKLQKWILSNTFLTRKMQVLVYGNWEASTKNIKPFFTATYHESEKSPLKNRDLNNQICFNFVGALVSGKGPLYAIQLVESLQKKGFDVALNLYGDGVERKILEDYIVENHLEDFIQLKGNQSQEAVKEALKLGHFVILPSESEGWPKAVAEAMFWGCVPIATKVSCVPFMLDFGKRGFLLDMDLTNDSNQLETCLRKGADYHLKSQKAMEWSRKFTLELFEEDIKKLLQG